MYQKVFYLYKHLLISSIKMLAILCTLCRSSCQKYVSHLPSTGSENPSWGVHIGLLGISFFVQSYDWWGPMEKPLLSEEAWRDMVGRGAGCGQAQAPLLRWWLCHLWRLPKAGSMELWKTPSLSKVLSALLTPAGACRQWQPGSEHSVQAAPKSSENLSPSEGWRSWCCSRKEGK